MNARSISGHYGADRMPAELAKDQKKPGKLRATDPFFGAAQRQGLTAGTLGERGDKRFEVTAGAGFSHGKSGNRFAFGKSREPFAPLICRAPF